MLKKYIISLFILLTSCSSQDVKIPRTSGTEDSIKLEIVRTLISDFQKVSSVQIEDSLLKVENQRLKDRYFSAINYALNGKEADIKSLYFQQKLEGVKEQRSIFEKQLVDVTKKYEYSVRENEGYKYTLAAEYERKNSILKDKAKLESDLLEAKKVGIVALRVQGFGYSARIFTKGKEVWTNKATDIKFVKVSFIIPGNKFADKEDKNLSVVLKSTDKKDALKKDTLVNYMGNEVPIELKLTGKEFKAGAHLLDVYMNGKLQTEIEFKIVK